MSPIVPVSSWDCVCSTLYPSISVTSSLWSKMDQSDDVIEGREVTTGEKQRPRRRWIHILTRLFVQWPLYAIKVQALELATNRISTYDIVNDSEMKIPPLRTQNLPVWCSINYINSSVKGTSKARTLRDRFAPPSSAFTYRRAPPGP